MAYDTLQLCLGNLRDDEPTVAAAAPVCFIRDLATLFEDDEEAAELLGPLVEALPRLGVTASVVVERPVVQAHLIGRIFESRGTS